MTFDFHVRKWREHLKVLLLIVPVERTRQQAWACCRLLFTPHELDCVLARAESKSTQEPRATRRSWPCTKSEPLWTPQQTAVLAPAGQAWREEMDPSPAEERLTPSGIKLVAWWTQKHMFKKYNWGLLLWLCDVTSQTLMLRSHQKRRLDPMLSQNFQTMCTRCCITFICFSFDKKYRSLSCQSKTMSWEMLQYSVELRVGWSFI